MSEDMKFLPKKDLLSLEELDRLTTSFIDLGVRKVRITGGEPLVRRDILFLFKHMSRHLSSGKLDEMTLTTNGSQLERFASELASMGVKRVNVSLDSLDADKFAKITRRGKLDQVLRGIDAAKNAGMSVKINAVAVRGFNDNEIYDLVDWAGRDGHDMTFIEVMPMGEGFDDADRVGSFYSLLDLRDDLDKRYNLRDIPLRTGGPARYVENTANGQKIGFITPLSHNFCESCNRVRVTCTGEIYTCLGQEGSQDLRGPLRASEGNEPLIAAIKDAISRKPRGHDFDYSRGGQSGQMSRTMSHTGG